MKAFISHTLTGIDSLELEDVAAPSVLAPGQIRVAMRAASLNYRDLLVLSGALRAVTLPDLIPCSDGAGEVIEVAADVARVKVGDRVALTFNPEWIDGPWKPTPGSAGRGGAIQGVMQTEAVVDQNESVLLPAHLSFEEGATLPCAAVTAWNALCGARPLHAGMTVLLQGGGGVSLFALQFAKMLGATVVHISSSQARCAKLKEMGADATIDYTVHPQWHLAVRQVIDGGVDLTIEVGGADTMSRSIASTRSGGRIAQVGRLSGPADASNAAASNIEVTRIVVGSRCQFEAMNEFISRHELCPVIDSRFRFDQLKDALRRLERGQHMGKIVIPFER